MKSTIGLWLGLGCLLGLAAGPVWADGVERDGIGAVSIGRGGTDVAHSDNGAVLNDNPAGMANVQGNGLFELSADVLFTDLHYSNLGTDHTENRHNPMPLPFLSYIGKSEDGRFAYGLGVFAPAGFGAEWRIDSPLLGEQRYKSFGAQINVLPGIAYRVTDRLSVGGTFGPGISTAQIDGPLVGQSGPLRGVPTLISIHATGVTPAWSLGLQYQLDDRTTLGLSYINEKRFHMNGNAEVSVAGLGPAPIGSRFEVDAHLTWPRSLAGGVTHVFGADHQHRASMDVIWYDWSSAFDDVPLEFSHPSNPLISALVGPTISDRFVQNWYDSVSVRLGYEYFLDPSQVFRFGYIYHVQPIPNSTLTPYIPAILKHAVSAGYGKQWENWGVNFAYQYSFGDDQTVGQSGLAGGDFNNSRIGASVHWLTLSVQYRF